jgi:signal transduction histidine kinase
MIPSIGAYFQGKNLRFIFEEVRRAIELDREASRTAERAVLLGYRLNLAAFLAEAEPLTEAAFLALCQHEPQPLALGWYFLLKGQRLYLGDRPQEAYHCLECGKAAIFALDRAEMRSQYHFFSFLCLAAQTNGKGEKTETLQTHHYQALQALVAAQPQWAYQLALIEGVRAKGWDALQHYEGAIASARDQNLTPYLALGYQLTAKFWQQGGYPQQAQLNWQQALREYRAWGATAIAMQFNPDSQPSLEAATWLETARTLIDEADSARVYERAIAICLNFFPAQRGAIWMQQEGEWSLQAASPPEGEWPVRWLQTLAQQQQAAFLTASRNAWPDDPYFAAIQPENAWGMPLRENNNCWGVLYLEARQGAWQVSPSQSAAIVWLVAFLEQRWCRDRDRERLKIVQERAIAQERFASLGALTAGIAHEIKNPLNFVNNFAELSVELTQELLEELETKQDQFEPEAWDYISEIFEDLTQNLAKINQHGKRADSIIRGMLLHSRSSAGDRVSVDINALLAEYVNLAYHGMRAKDSEFNITIQSDYDANLQPLKVIPQNLSRAFLNLINNACYATRDRAIAEVEQGNRAYKPTLSVQTQDCGDRVEIRIRDNGTGIPNQVQQRIFEPFFTTKPTGIGTGLGLSISRDIIVKEHQGRLQLKTALNEYTEFILTLPKI